MAQNAFEDNQEEDWIQKVVELEKEKETLIAKWRNKTETRQIVIGHSQTLSIEKRKAAEWKNGKTTEENYRRNCEERSELFG